MKKINQHLKVGKKVIAIPLSEKVEQWRSSFLELIYFKQKKEFTESQFDLLTKILLYFFHHLKSYLHFFYFYKTQWRRAEKNSPSAYHYWIRIEYFDTDKEEVVWNVTITHKMSLSTQENDTKSFSPFFNLLCLWTTKQISSYPWCRLGLSRVVFEPGLFNLNRKLC